MSRVHHNAYCAKARLRGHRLPLLISSVYSRLDSTIISRRGFRTSACMHDHYRTLSVPPNATKAQIKSSYYKLSKEYHPDLTQDPKTKEKFQRVSNAYAVLGDDRARRAYDKSLSEAAGPHRHPSPGSAFRTHYADPSWAYETHRRPGATHAWEHTRRPGSHAYRHKGYNPSGQDPYTNSSSKSQFHPAHDYQGTNPFTYSHVQRATGFPKRATMTDADRLARVSGLWRAVQVIGIVLAVATLGGGFRASA